MRSRAGKRWGVAGARPALALLAVVALALTFNACGGSDSVDPGSVTLTIGSLGTPEEEILGQIYAQALRGAGYKVKERSGLDPEYRERMMEELKAHRLSGYPEHLNAALTAFFAVEDAQLPRTARDGYRELKTDLEKEGLTAFPPTPYSLNRPVAMLRSFAKAHGIEDLSDLRGKSEKMTLSGFTDCHFRLDCLVGLERNYRVFFESISYTYTPREVHQRYKVLEDGKFDASIVYTTDGRLATGKKKFITLRDDKHTYPAGNAVFVTRQKLVDEAGPELERTIVAAQKGLTLPAMQRLDAEVELEGKDPAKVAAGYLKSVGVAG